MQEKFLTFARVVTIAAAASVATTAHGAEWVGTATLQDAGLAKYWDAHLPIRAGDSVRDAFLVDDAIYVTTNQGVAYAVSADMGLIRWADQITDPGFTIFRPNHFSARDGSDSFTLFATTTDLQVRGRFTGESRVKLSPEFPLGGPVANFGPVVLAGSTNGLLYCLSLASSPPTAPVTRWRVDVGSPITASTVLFDRWKLLAATNGGRVFCCRADDKAFLWSYETGGPILGDPFVDESGVYVSSGDQSVYKLHRDSGRVEWRYRLSSPLLTGPVVVAHTLYQHCRSTGVSAIDAHIGKRKWRQGDGLSFMAHFKDRDVLLAKGGRLLIVDHESGEVRQEIDILGVAVAVTNLRDDALYCLSADGRMLCARMETVPYLRKQQILAARERLNMNPASAADSPPAAGARESRETAEDPLRSRRDIRP